MMTFTLDFTSVVKIDDEQFAQICKNNPDVQFERSAAGELIIMPPVGVESGNREMDLMGQLWNWNRSKQLGKVFSSSTCFKLPNGALKSPDAAWVELSKWQNLDLQERKKFACLCPDFVIELRSESDSLRTLQNKMTEYIENGVKLGWLIDPQKEEVTVYQVDKEPEVLVKPQSINGDDILPDFVCTLDFLW
ncbi:protein of unknown function DUF820 [[Leptolyngbya] sp. PCC 7376]|uniref:Uma2 family endonuclease n=1 Tax=[Leptolyngbya] sp. PCC 7376 TaxID=111781 RepID=UPI00029F462A|nr:Uma2 family endonuclease [[Leptolyngbya] sp. PCC 7376]AFY37691.1 protein of unknown function DUF820 [[Leptolyngbya] sp. PCC 7376]